MNPSRSNAIVFPATFDGSYTRTNVDVVSNAPAFSAEMMGRQLFALTETSPSCAGSPLPAGDTLATGRCVAYARASHNGPPLAGSASPLATRSAYDTTE